MSDFHNWFRCPDCNDEGEVTQALFFDLGSLKFKCCSNEHARNRIWRNRYTVRETENSKTDENLIEKIVFGNSKHTELVSGDMKSCIVCPKCNSSNTDGSLEHMKFKSGDVGICGTVWCNSCNNYCKNIVTHKNQNTELVSKNSKYPPNFIKS